MTAIRGVVICVSSFLSVSQSTHSFVQHPSAPVPLIQYIPLAVHCCLSFQRVKSMLAIYLLVLCTIGHVATELQAFGISRMTVFFFPLCFFLERDPSFFTSRTLATSRYVTTKFLQKRDTFNPLCTART
jgi:hypothetical protein